MKKLFLSFLIITFSTSLFCQNNQDYMQVMVQQKKSFKMARTIDDFNNMAENFESIANLNTDKWHPLYYAAFCRINMCLIENEANKKDGHLDEAQVLIDRAIEIYPEESELFVLQGLLYQGRLQIDPTTRGPEFGVKANNAFYTAKDCNPNNPRAYYLLGMNILHMPESMGGGTVAACPILKEAKQKFIEDVPVHVLNPTWGGEENLRLYNRNCGKPE